MTEIFHSGQMCMLFRVMLAKSEIWKGICLREICSVLFIKWVIVCEVNQILIKRSSSVPLKNIWFLFIYLFGANFNPHTIKTELQANVHIGNFQSGKTANKSLLHPLKASQFKLIILFQTKLFFITNSEYQYHGISAAVECLWSETSIHRRKLELGVPGFQIQGWGAPTPNPVCMWGLDSPSSSSSLYLQPVDLTCCRTTCCWTSAACTRASDTCSHSKSGHTNKEGTAFAERFYGISSDEAWE